MKLSLGRTLCLLGLVSSLVSIARADEERNDPLAGHSLHGEAFNEGPRQEAYLMEGMPAIRFPITADHKEAQAFFNQGIGQLHGFWYFEAERSFRHVAALDTNCAMAYWGMAMANVNNTKRAGEFIKKAVTLKDKTERREQLWIDSLAKFYKDGSSSNQRHRDYVRDLERIVEEFPDELEAKAFLVFKIWENAGRYPISSFTALDALANDVLAVDPMHPVHHARIHLWNGERDKRALNSAARCGQSSPGIAHMWHMPGHTYSSLHRYRDAAWQQEAGARVDHAQMIRDRLLPDQIHNYAHNNEWLIRNLSYLGRVHDAIDLAKNLIELPRHPVYNTLARFSAATYTNETAAYTAVYNKRSGSASYGRSRLFELLLRYELWDQLIALSRTMYLEQTDIPEEQSKRLKALGQAYFSKGNKKAGQQQLTQLERLLKKQRSLRFVAAEEAETKARDDKQADDKISKAMTDAIEAQNRRIKTTENAITELRLYQALAEKDLEAARKLLPEVKDLPKERLATIHFQLGDEEKSLKLAREAANASTNQVQVLGNYADLLWRAGKTNDAQEAFERLRQIAAQADLNLPLWNRLKPLAKSLSLPKDWRTHISPGTDVGERPDLNDLGPFRWHPSPAPEWSLADAGGITNSLQEYRGKPVVVIFYLGVGCRHCLEQLNAFAPMTEKFAAAGISLVAISTDSSEGLKETFSAGSDKTKFPFPLLSDESLQVFKQYRAFDDFEQIPLHGTFLIDGDGLVRWQDINYQPFKETGFLLGEAKRLLKLPAPGTNGKKKEGARLAGNRPGADRR